MTDKHATHDEKMRTLIQNLAAKFLSLESNRTSLITVTGNKLSPDSKNMTIYFTVMPDHSKDAVTDFVKRKRSDFREYVKAETKLNRIPFFDFEYDLGEKHRQRIDELI